MLSTQFKQRLVMGTLGFFAIFISIYYSTAPLFKPIFVLLNAAFFSFALLEYYQLAKQKGFLPLISLGLICGILYILSLAWVLHRSHLAFFPSFVLWGALLLSFCLFFNQRSHSLGNLAVTFFGIIYLIIPLSCGIRINYFFPPESSGDGRLWLAYVLIVSKMTDVGAYFVGKSLGKSQLAPAISPKKTIEGAIGGIIAAILTSYIFALFFSIGKNSGFHLTWQQSLGIGFLMSLFAQLGDLAESILKRDAGVKDSSQLPGFGGVLDIVDSLVFTLPFLYFLLQATLVG